MSRISRQKSRLPPRLRKRSDFFSSLLKAHISSLKAF